MICERSLFEEYHRVCRAVAASPAKDIRSLLIKKNVVEGVIILIGSSATSSLLIHSFFDDFDRLICKGRFVNPNMTGDVAGVISMLGDLVAIIDGPLVDTCLAFWRIWASVDSRSGDFDAIDELHEEGAVKKLYQEELSDWMTAERLFRRLAAIPAYSAETLAIKRQILSVCLEYSKAFSTPPALLRSFFMDCDRVLTPEPTGKERIESAAATG
jgi:hypothetical protein